MAELKLNGYYTLEDGTKSIDPINAKLFKVKTKRSKKNEDEAGDSKEVKSSKMTTKTNEEGKMKEVKVI